MSLVVFASFVCDGILVVCAGVRRRLRYHSLQLTLHGERNAVVDVDRVAIHSPSPLPSLSNLALISVHDNWG